MPCHVVIGCKPKMGFGKRFRALAKAARVYLLSRSPSRLASLDFERRVRFPPREHGKEGA
jgi:hypothetical protein